jgi:Scavenger mRNA decapping enzyme C-term binding
MAQVVFEASPELRSARCGNLPRGKQRIRNGGSMKGRGVVVVAVLSLAAGVVLGGNLFARTQPRSVIALTRCTHCWRLSDLAGLMASVGIQQAPGLMPLVAFETEKTIAIKVPSRRIHYVLFPKRDIRNLGEVTEANAPYLVDACLVARHLIEKDKLEKYQFTTNGPGYQDVTYLHFHLEARR